MANTYDLARLKKGVGYWNKWMKKRHLQVPDFDGANLSKLDLNNVNFYDAYLIGVNFEGANLDGAILRRADLFQANLSEAKLNSANLSDAYLDGANLVNAELRNADLYNVDLSGADLSGANLSGADLTGAKLINTKMHGATLDGCKVFGISSWKIEGLETTKQSNLLINDKDEPVISVDNIEVAQFIYLLLNSNQVRDVIDTITSKVVLILGRFTSNRKAVLDAIRDDLRKRGYLPLLFDFEKPVTRDITETVSTLAHLARFVIADITDAKSVPQELSVIVPNLPSVPIQPILLSSEEEYGMFEHFKRYPWVLKTYLYRDAQELVRELEDKVIIPAEKKVHDLRQNGKD